MNFENDIKSPTPMTILLDYFTDDGEAASLL
jgi:hypothetical protein